MLVIVLLLIVFGLFHLIPIFGDIVVEWKKPYGGYIVSHVGATPVGRPPEAR